MKKYLKLDSAANLIGDKKIPFSRWWRFVRGAPEAWLINTFDLARPPVPEILVWLNLPVPDAMDRIRSCRELRPHETPAFFERLPWAIAAAVTEPGAITPDSDITTAPAKKAKSSKRFLCYFFLLK